VRLFGSAILLHDSIILKQNRFAKTTVRTVRGIDVDAGSVWRREASRLYGAQF
jgi:hypothetical protein